jgi:H2-forming N5,N10-methylenetetrahydromethanopterin dehydrogenase-like enzyme
MTPAVLGAREGRPATTVAGLTRALERARLVNVSLREQLHAEQREGSDLAEAVRLEAANVRRALLADRWDLAEQAANAIGYRAARHLRQRSSGVL